MQIDQIISLVSSAVTAVATGALFYVTYVLAKETRKMAESSSRPMVTVNLLPNEWSIIHIDFVVENTGNASAFDILIDMEPQFDKKDEKFIPYQKISILNPGEKLVSYVGQSNEQMKNIFKIEISWARSPGNLKRDSLRYEIDLGQYDGVSWLGGRNPMVAIAQQIKHIREDWRYVASGTRRIRVDSYSRADRSEERRQQLEQIEQFRKDKGQENP